MSKYVERKIPARSLLTGFRAIGYSFPTAVADIIDNSISASAKEIRIISDPLDDEPYFCIFDNGCGMDDEEIDNAMLLGSDRTGKKDSEKELGRFGLGLKSASLSQCRRLIVASKKKNYSHIIAMDLDLDIIERDNLFKLGILNAHEVNCLPCIDLLKKSKSGTLVIWNKFDRIENSAKTFEETFGQAVADAKKHVELVFHRFYDSVKIYFNEIRIDKRDPFLLSSHGRQQTGRKTEIKIDGKKIEVTPYTLPFANTLTKKERELLGNPKSIYDDQGFYLYRNKRLIAWGGWMKMGYKSELNKLARVQIDFPSTLDSVWTLDVKKSSAKIPDKLKENIFASLNDAVHKSHRTSKCPGLKESNGANKLWERIVNKNDGDKVSYQINRENPTIKLLMDSLGREEQKLFGILLSQLESYIPKGRLQNDFAESVNIQNSPDDIELETVVKQFDVILGLTDLAERESVFENLFATEQYQKFYDQKDLIKKRVM